MTNRDIVLKYLRCFCRGDISGVKRVLAPDLRLTGPLYKFESRDGYIESLKQDPPEPSHYEIIDIAESDTGILVFYVYQKASGRLTIAQFFKFRAGKISEMLLVFDTKKRSGSVNMVLFLKNLLFTIVVPGTFAIYVPLFLAGEQSPGSGVWLFIPSVFFLVGGAIYLWCVWDFATFGRGTPAPFDAPNRLVVRGLYHYTRNPMYVGVLTTIFGWAVFFWTLRLLLYGLCVGLGFHLFVILYEEPHLQKVFGTSYDEYRARVDRWLPNIIQLTRHH